MNVCVWVFQHKPLFLLIHLAQAFIVSEQREGEWTSRTGQSLVPRACCFVQHPQCILPMDWCSFAAGLVSSCSPRGLLALSWWEDSMASGIDVRECLEEPEQTQPVVLYRYRRGSYCFLPRWLLLCYSISLSLVLFYPPLLYYVFFVKHILCFFLKSLAIFLITSWLLSVLCLSAISVCLSVYLYTSFLPPTCFFSVAKDAVDC